MFSIFVLVGFALTLGIGIAVIITRRPPPGGPFIVPPEEEAEDPQWKNAELPMEKIFAYAEKLCMDNKLTIKDKMVISPEETYWITESTNEFFVGSYVIGFYSTSPEKRFVTYPILLEFKDFIRSVGGSKGLYFTNGFFTRDVLIPLEGSKVTLYNKKRLLTEMKKTS